MSYTGEKIKTHVIKEKRAKWLWQDGNIKQSTDSEIMYAKNNKVQYREMVKFSKVGYMK